MNKFKWFKQISEADDRFVKEADPTARVGVLDEKTADRAARAKKIRLIAVLAAVLAAALIALPLIIAFSRAPDGQPGVQTGSQPDDPTSAGPFTEPAPEVRKPDVVPPEFPEPDGIPDWYESGQLELAYAAPRSLVGEPAREAAANAAGTGFSVYDEKDVDFIILDDDDVYRQAIVDLKKHGRFQSRLRANNPAGHEFCVVYDDLQSGSTFCLTHAVSKKLGIDLKDFAGENPRRALSVMNRESADGNSQLWIVGITNAAGVWTAGYFYDADSGEFYPLPSYLISFENVYGGGPYAAGAISPDLSMMLGCTEDQSRLALLRLTKEGVNRVVPLPVNEGFRALEEGPFFFSDDGRFFITPQLIDGNRAAKTDGFTDLYYCVFDTKTEKSLTLTGQFFRFCENGRDAAVLRSDGLHFYDLETGEDTTGKADVKDYESNYFEHFDLCTVCLFGQDNRILRDGVYENADSYFVKDGYLYLFSIEKELIICRELTEGGRTFSIRPAEAFLQVLRAPRENKRVYAEIFLSKDGKTLYLCAQSEQGVNPDRIADWVGEEYGSCDSYAEYAEQKWRALAEGDGSAFRFASIWLYGRSAWSTEQMSLLVRAVLEKGTPISKDLASKAALYGIGKLITQHSGCPLNFNLRVRYDREKEVFYIGFSEWNAWFSLTVGEMNEIEESLDLSEVRHLPQFVLERAEGEESMTF